MSDEHADSNGSRHASLFGDANNWRSREAARFGWLIDGEDYFTALRHSVDAAEREILILGWDIDSRVELIRDRDSPHYPSPLAATLESLVERKPDIRVFVLSWDFAVLYVLERELLPARAFGWHHSDRLHFKLDKQHATGASHHQKIVVVDGALAYCGGIDLTKCRWDTRSHAQDDPRRCDPSGTPYRPFHDVQAVVTGAVVADLRELASQRWLNATGQPLPDLDVAGDGDALWPANAPIRAEHSKIAIARTWTGADGDDCINEVEKLYLDMIAGAKHSIYIENQYFTSVSIAAALARRLQEEDGPEVVLLLPGETSGWLEQATMDILRNRAIDRLQSADHFDRLRIVTPVSDELNGTPINVHAKIMIVDVRVARIGSANLSRRSMGLDSECDLVIEDDAAAAALCADLLSEHLGADFDAVKDCLDQKSLIATIERFNQGSRRLEPLGIDASEIEQALLEPVAKIADLEQPLVRTETDDENYGVSRFSMAGGLLLAGLVAVAGWWLYRTAQESSADFSLQALLTLLRSVSDHPLALFLVPPAFVAGSLVFAPVTGMIALCALLFDPWIASAVAIVGTLAATVVNHWLGSHFHAALMSWIPDKIADRIGSIASSSDALTLAGLRLIPIAPFTLVNLVVGASGIGLRSFLLGTVITMSPGIVVICLSVDRARAALAGEPVFDPWIVAGIAVAGIATIALRVWQKKRKTDQA